jgi:hypothetical protein
VTRAEEAIHQGEPARWFADQMRDHPQAWCEIDEKQFWYCLEVLPPIYVAGGFQVSEAFDHDDCGRPIYATVAKVGFRYYIRHLTTADAGRAIRTLRDGLGVMA